MKSLNIDSFQSPLLKQIIKQFKTFVQDLYGVRLDKLILFGSQARGEATLESDVDILIVTHQKLTKQERQQLIQFISQIAISDDVLINFVEMNPPKFDSEKSPLLLNIHREGIIL
ncbi:MAG: nucleotidyltransferase domain-containing protein [Microcystaceae cyanobacterium]